MAEVPVHFIGFLANVDDSILKLNCSDDFSISKVPAGEIKSFLEEFRDWYGKKGMSRIVNAVAGECYCVRKEAISDYERPPHGTCFPNGRWQGIKQQIEDRIRCLRMSFLSLMISMEAMLGPESPGEVTHQVSRNAAVLLGASRSESQDIYRHMKRLYAKRSKVVHGGRTSKEKDRLKRDDVLNLREYARKAIRALYELGSLSKDQVQTLLNPCGFGQRPNIDDQ